MSSSFQRLALALTGVALTALLGVSVASGASMSASAASCPKGATLNFVAHQDDDLLFQNPKLLQEARSGVCMRTVYMLAGDAGDSDSYWQNREFGARAAYAETMSVADQWTKTDAGIAGHPIPLWTLNGAPHVSLAFMRLPDGNIDGSGFPSNGSESLQKLYSGTMDRIYPVDGTASYTLDGVLGTLLAFMTSFQPNSVNTLDYTATYGSGLDHSDHMTVAYLAIMAQREYTTPHGFAGYQGYGTQSRPVNVSGSDFTRKADAFLAYTEWDYRECSTVDECNQRPEGAWLQRMYTVGTPTPVPPVPTPTATPTPTPTGRRRRRRRARPPDRDADADGHSQPDRDPDADPNPAPPPPLTNRALTATVTASSQASRHEQTAQKAIDGVINGYPGDHTKEWATTGGKAGSFITLNWSPPQTLSSVRLYDRPNTSDQVTAGTLTFSDGSSVAVPALSNGGGQVTVSFTDRATTSLRFTVTSVSTTTANVGLAEIQAYGYPTPMPTPTPTPDADAHADADPDADAHSDAHAHAHAHADPDADADPDAHPDAHADPDAHAHPDPTPTPTPTNVAPSATAIASSQNTSTGQTAAKAIDGTIAGYPGDHTKEWATVNGRANSTLTLNWSSSRTLSSVRLYDRPNTNDQVTGGTLTFSNGTSVTVPSLNNGGGAITVNFTPRATTSLKFTVTSVSGSTVNVGLAEIQAYGYLTSAAAAPAALGVTPIAVATGTEPTPGSTPEEARETIGSRPRRPSASPPVRSLRSRRSSPSARPSHCRRPMRCSECTRRPSRPSTARRAARSASSARPSTSRPSRASSTLDAATLAIMDADGNLYPADDLEGDDLPEDGVLQEGAFVSGSVLFQVPMSARSLSLVLLAEDGVTVTAEWSIAGH